MGFAWFSNTASGGQGAAQVTTKSSVASTERNSAAKWLVRETSTRKRTDPYHQCGNHHIRDPYTIFPRRAELGCPSRILGQCRQLTETVQSFRLNPDQRSIWWKTKFVLINHLLNSPGDLPCSFKTGAIYPWLAPL